MGKAAAMKGKTVDIDQRDEEIWRLGLRGTCRSGSVNLHAGDLFEVFIQGEDGEVISYGYCCDENIR